MHILFAGLGLIVAGKLVRSYQEYVVRAAEYDAYQRGYMQAQREEEIKYSAAMHATQAAQFAPGELHYPAPPFIGNRPGILEPVKVPESFFAYLMSNGHAVIRMRRRGRHEA